MGILKKILNATQAAYDKFYEDDPEENTIDNNENYNKGIEFEKYILDLFSPDYFKIHDITRDNSKNINRRVESDSNPDLTIKHIKTSKLFSVECKFKSQTFKNGINWAKKYKIQNYKNYESTHNRPTFIVIGLGGTPTRPERMFCLPLKEAKYTNLFMSLLEQYERSPNKPFEWKNENLF